MAAYKIHQSQNPRYMLCDNVDCTDLVQIIFSLTVCVTDYFLENTEEP